MSEAPEQIGLVEDLPGRWRLWTREDDGPHQDHAVRYVRADRLEAQEALLKEAMGAFENAMGHLDTPISRRKIGIDPNEEWLLDARATLAKLRAHLEGEKK